MTVGHVHDRGHTQHGHRARSRRALSISLALTVAYGIVQIATGVLFHSLSLLADAVHNVSDGGTLALALLAAWAAGLPARGRRTYGWRRAEILAALVNGLLLVAVSGWILYEASQRLGHPVGVVGPGVLAVGLVGVVANGVPVLVLLRAGARSNLNLRSAMLHAGADVLGSAGAALAGLIVWTTGWAGADPVIGAGIALLVLVASVGLIRESLRILMELAPGDCDPEQIGQAMAQMPGVKEVHDLHIWTITSGFPSLSAHVVIQPEADHADVLHAMERLLQERFGLDHTTLQVDRDHSTLIKLRPSPPRRGKPVGGQER